MENKKIKIFKKNLDLATHKPARYQTFAMDFSNYFYFRAYVKALTWEKRGKTNENY